MSCFFATIYQMNIQELVQGVNQSQLKAKIADVRVGETVKVHYKIREGNKERIQIFEGVVTATKSGKSLQGSFTVRKIASGVGVERTFPLHSPWLVKIERIKSGKVRRAKLNYIRNYAMSSRFKLRDKGLEGATWDTAEDAKGDAVDESVAQESEIADNTTNDVEAETVGEPSGDAGSESPASEEVSDSGSESKN